MKYLLSFLFSTALFSGICYAQQESRVIFYRENNITGAAVTYTVFANGLPVARLKNGSYTVFKCSPGNYTFRVEKFRDTEISMRIEKGRTYYLRFGLKTGMWSAIPEMIAVDSVSAYPAIKNGMLKYTDMYIPAERKHNRLGINTFMGFGFEGIPWIITTNGDVSKANFGGGYGIALSYGRELGNYFDLSADLGYQFSELRPVLKNASVTFGRFMVSVTPAFVINFKKQEAMRIRIGAGPDYYFSPLLNIKTSEIPGGFNEKWKYSNKAGFHITGLYEMDISERWSVSYGLKYYSVSYEFSSGGEHYPSDPSLQKPSGSGLDFIVGFHYRF